MDIAFAETKAAGEKGDDGNQARPEDGGSKLGRNFGSIEMAAVGANASVGLMLGDESKLRRNLPNLMANGFGIAGRRILGERSVAMRTSLRSMDDQMVNFRGGN